MQALPDLTLGFHNRCRNGQEEFSDPEERPSQEKKTASYWRQQLVGFHEIARVAAHTKKKGSGMDAGGSPKAVVYMVVHTNSEEVHKGTEEA